MDKEIRELFLSFQSYQGSIFTQESYSFSFQSYQGSIFTQLTSPWFLGRISSFNPIKVLFLRKIRKVKWIGIFTFNPIKVLFLQNNGILNSKGISLSILSRFYFYRSCIKTQRQQFFTFNPIKVLFLQIVQDTRFNKDRLSILSRFYFYTGT